MAKKTAKSTAPPAKLTDKDKKTLKSLRELAGEVAVFAERSRAPYLDVPSRSLSNVKFNQSQKIIEMGSGTNRRELFNLSQAKAYMQTLLVGKGCKELITQGKTTSIRSLFYLLKHTIEGTQEETFDTQDECDPIIEDAEVTLDAMREELHLFAKNAGAMVGPITLIDSGDEIDCARMGSGGYSVPSICEPETVEFKKSDAEFVLFVEKDAVWRRFNEDRFWKTHGCILIHGGGQPPRGVRRLVHRFNKELKLPVYCLLDNDPWGYYIYSVLKQGSINLAYESRRMAIPDAKFLGVRSSDYERCGLKPSASIKLNDQDIKRAKQIAAYPWFEKKKAWQKEIDLMLKNGFKLEVEALSSKGISYSTEEYVPQRLEEQDFLD
jgi:DNA topoisomerase-6 subunit A